MNPILLGVLFLQVQLASVDGVVLKPDGREPLGRTTVTLTPVVRDVILRGPSAVTEDDGRFMIQDVPPGEYQLVVDTARYGHVVYGQRRPDGPGIILTLTEGQSLKDLRLTMPPTGAISGRITGRNSEPPVNASVQALRYAYQNGRRTLQIASTATTDDRGEYRLFGLPAGSYLVAAALSEFANGPYLSGVAHANPVGQAVIAIRDSGQLITLAESMQRGDVVHRVLEDGTVQEESWAPLYYPSTTEARYAVPIEVGGSATRTGIDISIGPSRVQAIRGRVTGGSALSPPRITFSREDLGVSLVTSIVTQPDGSFELSGVLSGTYYLRASDTRTGLVSAPLSVEVSDRDIDNLQIGLVPGLRIGVVVLQDNPSGPQPLPGIGVILQSESAGSVRLSVNGPTQAGTGRSSIDNVAPGNYQIQITQPPPSSNSAPEPGRFHIKAVRFGGQDASEGIRVDAGTPNILEVVVTNQSGSVTGLVNAAGQGVAQGATVVLVPEKGRKRAELYSATISDGSGSFHFDGIAPGEYRLFAWDDVETGAWQDAEYLRNFEGQGQRVTVSGNSTQDVRLTLIQNP